MKLNVPNILTEKKKKTGISGKPGNELKKMQQHNAAYNKKHPHSLPYEVKDAGNVEYNNYIFNHSTRSSSDGESGPVDASDASAAVSSAGFSGVSVGGDAGGAVGGGDAGGGGESLSVAAALKYLNESDVDSLTEGPFSKLFKKNKETDDTNKEDDKLISEMRALKNGIIAINKNTKAIIDKKSISEYMVKNMLSEVIDNAKALARRLPDSIVYVVRDGKEAYSTGETTDNPDNQNLVLFVTTKDGTKQYETIKYNGNKYLGKHKKDEVPDNEVFDIGKINGDLDEFKIAYILYTMSHTIKDGTWVPITPRIKFKLLVNNKLLFNSEDLEKSDNGKRVKAEAENKAKIAADDQAKTDKERSKEVPNTYVSVVVESVYDKYGNYQEDIIRNSGKLSYTGDINQSTSLSNVGLKDIINIYKNLKGAFSLEVYWIVSDKDNSNKKYTKNTLVAAMQLGTLRDHPRIDKNLQLIAGHPAVNIDPTTNDAYLAPTTNNTGSQAGPTGTGGTSGASNTAGPTGIGATAGSSNTTGSTTVVGSSATAGPTGTGGTSGSANTPGLTGASSTSTTNQTTTVTKPKKENPDEKLSYEELLKKYGISVAKATAYLNAAKIPAVRRTLTANMLKVLQIEAPEQKSNKPVIHIPRNVKR